MAQSEQINEPEAAAPAGGTEGQGPWAPFRQRAFAVLWIATVISNTGTWMNDVGAGWLMTNLAPSPQIVAAVQAATTLPVFLFALVAGAVADIVDRRRLLIIVNAALSIVAFALTATVHLGAMTPLLLLVFTFLLGSGAAFLAPAWQAIVPRLVPRSDLGAAVALNSMGINISRAIGPALAGALIVGFGLIWPFLLNAISTLVVLAALIWWRPAPARPSALPPEHVLGAMAAGLRFALHTRPLQLVLLRAAGFFLFASAYWAMLPLIAREVLAGDAGLYGLLLGAVGLGAVTGALVLPRLRRVLGPDRTVLAGTLGTVLALLAFALAPHASLALVGSFLAGTSWIAVLSSFNVAAQLSLPDWVRARGLSIFLTVFFGSMSLGSLFWGAVAAQASIRTALLIAGAGALAAIPLTARARLAQAGEDHSPSRHWPDPEPKPDFTGQDAPATIWIVYRVPEANRARFLALMQRQKARRRAQGAHGWTLRVDVADRTRLIESWHEASWTAHLRHHERVSRAEQALQDEIRALLAPGTAPEITHSVAPQ